ncbi:uncharacterized protein LOC115746779 [Rhodamnia argentea]|uniref:Uncharacterized protein LOC115746779 n=1 Tax=Rhodamnia argentea TaxID=178133 RepID=A0A8B8PWB2_9MYRT|nr:uncharacterized protein LOC115746779 [Rhodamnia argentea]
MATRMKLSKICSLLMGLLFACSASVQLNDPDWYLWMPLYSSACLVNLTSMVFATSKMIPRIGKPALWLGMFLFAKVAVEGYRHQIAGFWSLDMRERVVREKFGSGLVVFSMFLHLEAASKKKGLFTRKDEGGVVKHIELGQMILVGIGYGMSLVFFVFQKDEMKF